MTKPQVTRKELNASVAAANQAKRIAARKAREALLPALDLSKFF